MQNILAGPVNIFPAWFYILIEIGLIIFTIGIVFLIIITPLFFKAKRKQTVLSKKLLAAILILSIIIGIPLYTIVISNIGYADRARRAPDFYPCKWVLCVGNTISPYSTAGSQERAKDANFNIYQADKIQLPDYAYKLSYFEVNKSPVSNEIYVDTGYASIGRSMGFRIRQRKFEPIIVSKVKYQKTPEGYEVWGHSNSEFMFRKGDTLFKVDGVGFNIDGDRDAWGGPIPGVTEAMKQIMNAMQETPTESLIHISRSKQVRAEEEATEIKNDKSRRGL